MQELKVIDQQITESKQRLRTLEQELSVFKEELQNAQNAEVQAKAERANVKTLMQLKGETLSAKQLVEEAVAAIQASKEKIRVLEGQRKPLALKALALELAKEANDQAAFAESIFITVAEALVKNHGGEFIAARERIKRLAGIRDRFFEAVLEYQKLTGERVISKITVSQIGNSHFLDTLEKEQDLSLVLSPWTGSAYPYFRDNKKMGLQHHSQASGLMYQLSGVLEQEGLLETSLTPDNHMDGGQDA